MNRRDRLMATMRGEPVDRPPVCFYEINGLTQNRTDADRFNVYSDPSWHPLLDLAAEKTDRIVLNGIPFINTSPDPLNPLTTTEKWTDENGSSFTRTSIRLDDRTLTRLMRRDPDVNTTWELEPLLKGVDDFKAWLDLPRQEFSGEPDTGKFLEHEKALGDTGIAAVDTADPLCCVAPLFEMGEYTIIGLTENALMHRALEKVAAYLLPATEAVAKALPGRLWRICGPEYASPPYLPPNLFEEYVTRYVTPMVEVIQKHGGFARVHSHGKLKDVLPHIAATGCTGLDPIEPPNQGDVELSYVREHYGGQMVLFGNIEASDIENMPTEKFAGKVEKAIAEGTAGEGRGFVLMPSACPYGRKLQGRAMRNYEKMVEIIERL